MVEEAGCVAVLGKEGGRASTPDAAGAECSALDPAALTVKSVGFLYCIYLIYKASCYSYIYLTTHI